MIRKTGYNFSNIQDVISAAENMQRAGHNDVCREILENLAKEILSDGKE